ncbi:MAG: PIN domain-containing protein [Candidatus Xenobiia bacterium LiM19]
MRIYFDVCALNRPFDDQTQDRIHLESEAVLSILNKFMEKAEWSLIGSEAIEYEISKIPDPLKKNKVMFLSQFAGECIPMTEETVTRARKLQKFGFSPLDSLHIACAEKGNAQIFLTTDDQLIQKSRQHRKNLHVTVENPLKWLVEKTYEKENHES